MAIWIDRKRAAEARMRYRPVATTKEEEDAISVRADVQRDLARVGEKFVAHEDIFDDAAIKNIKAKSKELKAVAAIAEKKAKAEAKDYSKDFGEEGPVDAKK